MKMISDLLIIGRCLCVCLSQFILPFVKYSEWSSSWNWNHHFLKRMSQLGPPMRHKKSSLPQEGQLGPLVRHKKSQLSQKRQLGPPVRH